MEISLASVPSVEKSVGSAPTRDLEAAAKEFETVFVRQMLEHAGFAEAFGAKEDSMSANFTTFLLDRLASDMVEKGGFGFADQVYQKLSQTDSDTIIDTRS